MPKECKLLFSADMELSSYSMITADVGFSKEATKLSTALTSFLSPDMVGCERGFIGHAPGQHLQNQRVAHGFSQKHKAFAKTYIRLIENCSCF